jgi:hypothetical protein
LSLLKDEGAMNIAYEMLIIAILIVATLVVAQGFESGVIDRPHVVRVSFTHSCARVPGALPEWP